MERQLANLTGLVQKALTQTPTTHLQVPGRDGYRGTFTYEWKILYVLVLDMIILLCTKKTASVYYSI